MIRKSLVTALIPLISSVTLSQNVTIKAYAPGVVELGEQFRLTYTLTARPTSFTPPAIAHFDIIAGPSTSTNTSIEMINGNVTQSQTYTYTYILEAGREGKFSIDAAEAVVNGDKVRSNPLTVEVVKASANARQDNQAAGGDDLAVEELFVAIETNKKSAYVGEPIEATIKIYTRVGIVGFEEAKFPTFNGFWSQEIATAQNIAFERVNVNGRIYNMGIVRKYLLFPQKSSNLEISPFELGVIYQGRPTRSQSIFDEFFGGIENRRKRLVSRPLILNIKPLPGNSPESFVGAVGTYRIEATADKPRLKTNEAVTVKLKITGSGNLKLAGTPRVEFPAGFELFDPKASDNINTTASNTSGTKTVEYIAIPRSAGSFEIPPVEFTYFDLAREAYVTLRSKAMPIEVLADSSAATGVVMTGYGKEEVKFIGKDIRFIKTGHFKLRRINSFVVTSGVYIFTYIILAVIFLAFWYLYSRHREQMTDLSIVRTRKANKTAQKRLREASTMLNQRNAEKFYEEIHRALWGYAADKLSIPVADLSSDRVKHELGSRKVSGTDIEEFARIIDVCEFARFAPSKEYSQMDALYEAAYALISTLEQTLGKAKSNLW